MTLPPPIPPPARPLAVSLISGYYLISILFAGGALWLTYSGLLPIPQPQRAYLDSMSWVDHAITIFALAVKLAGAVAFFFLRRSAVYLFALALLANLSLTIYQIAAKGFLHSVGLIALPGMVIGWTLSAAILIYAVSLAKKGVLRG